MIRLKESENLGRKIRQDDLEDLGAPTWTLLREAIVRQRTGEALELMEYERQGLKRVHDYRAGVMALGVTYIADMFGEEEVPKCWRAVSESAMKATVPTGLDPLEETEACQVRQRQHQGLGMIIEEEDRYVLVCDPCGSGGKLRREGIGGVTKKAYPWSWYQTGIPYYCVHCSVMWEILCIEQQGYPLRINVLTDDINEPCYNYFYKKPELIPDKFYTRLRMEKPKE